MKMYDMKISVIIPSKNSERTIAKCLNSVLNQIEKPFEIIVVDGGSKDKTRKIAERLGAKVIIEPHHKGNSPGMARNYGAKYANGEVLAFLDSDCYPEKTWLSKIKNFLKDEKIGIYGIIVRDGRGSILSKAYHYLIREITYDFSPSRCMAIKKCVFDQVNGFDETLTAGEDNDLSYRVKKLGYKIIIDRETKVYHDDDHISSLRGIWVQQKWYFEAEKELRKRMPDKFKKFRTAVPLKQHLIPIVKAFFEEGFQFSLACLIIKLIYLRKHL
jgi:glycosyltransferase involved in cell wall biosynthesis